jgi:hypothetical protein
MSPPDPRIEQADCGRDVGAYALGALDPGELEEFRRHLGDCAACRDEVAALRSVVEMLPMATPQLAVPRGLRRRAMADVRAAQRAASRAQPRRFAMSTRRALGRGALAGAVALAALAGILIALTSAPGHARSVTAHVAYPSASAVVRVRSGHAELIVRRMPAAPAGAIYEVWLKRGARPPVPTSALFGVTSAGEAQVDVPGDLDGVSEVLVTPERLGGSPRPTHVPVIVARLA